MIAIGTMIEGPIVTLAAGFTASTDLLSPFAVFLSAATGNMVGDTFWYVVGYLGKTEWLFRASRIPGLKKEHVEQLEKDIHIHAPKLLFIAKLTLGLSIPTLLAAGLARVPLRKWYWAQVAAEVLWTGALTVFGYYFGHSMRVLERGVQIITIISSLLFVMVLFVYFKKFFRGIEK